MCEWIQYCGNLYFTTDCGRVQGIQVKPRQKKCYCGKHILCIKQDEITKELKQIEFDRIYKGIAYYKIKNNN